MQRASYLPDGALRHVLVASRNKSPCDCCHRTGRSPSLSLLELDSELDSELVAKCDERGKTAIGSFGGGGGAVPEEDAAPLLPTISARFVDIRRLTPEASLRWSLQC